MAYPKLGTERARPDLAVAFEEHDIAMNLQDLVGYNIWPLRDVDLAHGTYPRVEVKELFIAPTDIATKPPGFALERSPKGGYARDENRFTEYPYRTVEHGYEIAVDENESRHYASYYDHETFAAATARHQLLIQAELRISTAMFDTTVFLAGSNMSHQAGTKLPDGTTPTAAPWSSPTSTPVDDVRVAVEAVYDNSGVWPDSIVMNRKAFNDVRETDQIRERIHSQGAGDRDRVRLITAEQLAQIFNLQNVFVAGATYDTNNPNQVFAAGQIWGPHANVFKVASSSNFREPCIGRSLHWAADDSMPNGYVEDYREPQNRGHIIRVRHQLQELMLYPQVGYLITDVQ